MSNGTWSGEKVDGRVRFSWSEPAPMASYLALVDIGKGKLVHGQVGKLPTWTLVDPRLEKKSRAAIDSSRRSSAGSLASTGPIRSLRPARWSTSPTSSTRWRRSRGRSTRSRPTAPPSSTRPRTNGSAIGQPRALAQHLAERGLRDLDPVVLRRASRWPQRPAGLRRALPQTRLEDGILEPAVRPAGTGEEPVRGLDLRPRRDDAAGAAGPDRHPGPDRDPADLGDRTPPRPRRHRRVHRARRAGLGPSTCAASSTAGCSSAASPRRGAPPKGRRAQGAEASIPLAAGEAAEGDQPDRRTISPIQKLQTIIRTMPMMTRMPPSEIPPMPPPVRSRAAISYLRSS